MPWLPRRLPRRRGLLRHQRLPDHAAADPGVHRTSTISLRAVLAAPGPPPARRPVHAAGRRLGRRAGLLPRGRRRAGRAGLGRADLRHELVPDRHPTSRTSPPSSGRRCSSTCGRWRSRSSSTWCGRCSCSACCALFRGRQWPIAGRRHAGADRLAGVDGGAVRAGDGPEPRRTTAPTPGRRACCSAPPWRWCGSRATRCGGDAEVKTVALDLVGMAAVGVLVGCFADDPRDRHVPLPRRLRRRVAGVVRGDRRHGPPGHRARRARARPARC